MITAKSEITVENMSIAWWIYLNNYVKVLYGFTFLGLVIMGLSMIGFVSDPENRIVAVVFFAFGLLFAAIIPIRTNQFKQSIRMMPTFDDTFNFTFTDAELELQTDGIESRIAWRKLTTAVATERGILIMPNTVTFYWMPREGFLSDSDFFAAVEIVSRNILNTKRVGV